jgi:hypothetical protein
VVCVFGQGFGNENINIERRIMFFLELITSDEEL